jgi:hypothetical protein
MEVPSCWLLTSNRAVITDLQTESLYQVEKI